MTLREFAALLVSAYPKVYHYRSAKEKGNYVVWQEYGGKRQEGGPLSVHKIQVDIFTRIEFDPALRAIESALDRAGVARDSTKTTYEDDTEYIHHIILCEVIDSG